MARFKNIIIAIGLLLVIGGGGSAVASDASEVPPIVIAREAEAVTRAVRMWLKRPIPGIDTPDTPPAEVVAYVTHV